MVEKNIYFELVMGPLKPLIDNFYFWLLFFWKSNVFIFESTLENPELFESDSLYISLYF